MNSNFQDVTFIFGSSVQKLENIQMVNFAFHENRICALFSEISKYRKGVHMNANIALCSLRFNGDDKKMM